MSKSEVGMSFSKKGGGTQPRGECELCGKPCIVKFEDKVAMCAKCKNSPYPEYCFDPQVDLDFWADKIEKRVASIKKKPTRKQKISEKICKRKKSLQN